MKIYEFREACIAFCFVCFSLSLLCFGFIWLGKQYDAESIKFELQRVVYKESIESLERDASIIRMVQPSCLKEETVWKKQ